MKLPITIRQARLGSMEFKVIRPARPLVQQCSSIGQITVLARV